MALAHIAAWRHGCAGMLPDDTCTEDNPFAESYVEAWTQRRRQRLANPDLALETLVSEMDGVIVGHITYGRSSPDPTVAIGEVWSCYVHPDQWGTGVADALLLYVPRSKRSRSQRSSCGCSRATTAPAASTTVTASGRTAHAGHTSPTHPRPVCQKFVTCYVARAAWPLERASVDGGRTDRLGHIRSDSRSC